MGMNGSVLKELGEERSTRLAHGLSLLADMGRDFADTRDITGTLSRALIHITNYLEAEGGALFLLEDDSRILRCEASSGSTHITGLTMPSDQGVVGRVVQANRGEIVRDVAADPAFSGAVDARTGYATRSILCAPLSVKDESIGAIELVNHRGGDGQFDDASLALLEILCSSAALAILNAQLAATLVEQERVHREIELAAEIQRNLLPGAPAADFPVFGLNIPAHSVSGDFYDFFRLDDGRIAFCLGDVSGKGINAALLMAKTTSLYRCLGKTELSPGRLLARINNEICETATRGMFVTLIGGIYDPEADSVCFANAGHEPPLYRARDGTFCDFPAEAPPLGIMPLGRGEDRLPESWIELAGGAFYAFSDGVTEGTLAGGETLGADGLRLALAPIAAQPLDQRLGAIARLLARDDGVMHDDITLLGIDAARPAAASSAERASPHLTYRFAAKPASLQGARAAVRGFLADLGAGEALANDIVLAIDEACQNVIRHAYRNMGDGEIVLEMALDGRRLITHVRDFAPEIDAITVAPRLVDDVRPGGLGTHFMREIMDEVAYLRPDDGTGNLLRMCKEISLSSTAHQRERGN